MACSNKYIIFFVVLFIEFLLTFFKISELVMSAGLYVYVSIFIQVLLISHTFQFSKINSLYFCAPAFLFSLLALTYSLLGVLVFCIRDFFGFGLGGDPVGPVIFFGWFSCMAYFIFLLSMRNSFSGQHYVIKENALTKSYQVKLIIILILNIIGIYILTAGFSQIAIFGENPDEIRYANRANSNVAIGSLFLLFGIHAILIIADLLERKAISIVVFSMLFLIYYFPFVLSASRMLMLLPFVSLILIKTQRLRKISVKNLGLTVFIIILLAYLFGAYRSQGSFENSEVIVQFLQSDFFPEFSGAVYTQTVTNSRDFVAPLVTVASGILPSALVALFDVDKTEYFQLVGAVLGEMWNSQYSIRISLIGELYYTGYDQLIPFLVILVIFVVALNYKVMINPDRYRHIYIMTGLLTSLSIPYGASFMVIVVHFFIFSLFFFWVIDMFQNFHARLNL